MMSYFVRFRSSRLYGCINDKSDEISFVRFYTEVIKIDVDASYKGIPIPQAQKILLVESGILDFGICNTAQRIALYAIHDVESRIKDCLGFPYIRGSKGLLS